MTAEIKVFPDPDDLVVYLNALYAGVTTEAVVTVIKPSVYLIQHN